MSAVVPDPDNAFRRRVPARTARPPRLRRAVNGAMGEIR
jgi:hypothetical protein